MVDIVRRLGGEDFVLVVVGDGPEKNNIEKEIDRIGVKDKIILLGWVPNEDVYKSFTISDIFLMPSA